MSKPTLKSIALSAIRVNPVALRDVNGENEQYQNLVADVKRRGILQPISVLSKHDDAANEDYYLIIDGLHRYSAAVANDLEEIPVSVHDVDEADVIETQIVANLLKVDTKPVEYTKALQRMMLANPTMTLADLAEKISQSPTYVAQRLSLLKLEPAIQKLVDDGDIKLANAYALSKLPPEHQLEWLDQAQTQQPSEFTPAVTKRAKELAEAKRAGREAGGVEFEAVARLRKLAELKGEHDNASIGSALTTDLQTPAQGFARAIEWVLNLDSASVAAAKQKWETQKKMREDEKKKNAAVRETARFQDAAAKAAKARAESGMSPEEIDAAAEAQREAAAKAKAEKEAAAPATA